MTPATQSTRDDLASGSKGLHIGLWVAQVLLALAFLMAGGMKLVSPYEKLAENMPGMTRSMFMMVRFIGTVEVAGALGLILPSATRIMPKLTPLAAFGLFVVMVLAAGTHVMKHEPSHLVAPIVLGALAAFVMWGRWK